jgi:hypothetical protein
MRCGEVTGQRRLPIRGAAQQRHAPDRRHAACHVNQSLGAAGEAGRWAASPMRHMNTELMDDAYRRWSSGDTLKAGRLIYEQLPNDRRPLWAASILNLCRSLIQRVSEIDAVHEIASNPSRWKEAHAAFWPIRDLTLKAERSNSTDPVYEGVLHVTENTAKVTYNASGEPIPFDEDAGWWLVSNLRYLIDKVNDAEFEKKAWSIVSSSW